MVELSCHTTIHWAGAALAGSLAMLAMWAYFMLPPSLRD
jgi:hypothetical protein